MSTDMAGGIAALGLILLCLRFGGGLLPSTIRLFGNALVIYGCYMYSDGMGFALLVGGLLAIATSVWKIIKGVEEITMYDGGVIVIGLIEVIGAFIIGIHL